jgi:ATP phosphoribosyltransferase
MNERIKELLEQCQIETYGVNGELLEIGINAEKFAELIVKECADVCHTIGWGMLEHGLAGHNIVDDCGSMIKEHFGVEQ